MEPKVKAIQNQVSYQKMLSAQYLHSKQVKYIHV